MPEIFVIKTCAKFENKIIQAVAGTVTNVRVRVTRHNFVTRKWETTVADVIRGRRQSRDGFRPTASSNTKKDLPHVTHINIKEKSVDVNKGKINTTNTNWKAVNCKRKAE